MAGETTACRDAPPQPSLAPAPLARTLLASLRRSDAPVTPRGRRLIDRLQASWSNRNFEELSRFAHQAKGSLGYICAHAAKNAAAELEKRAKQLVADGPPADDAQILTEVADSLSALTKEMTRVSPAVASALCEVKAMREAGT